MISLEREEKDLHLLLFERKGRGTATATAKEKKKKKTGTESDPLKKTRRSHAKIKQNCSRRSCKKKKRGYEGKNAFEDLLKAATDIVFAGSMSRPALIQNHYQPRPNDIDLREPQNIPFDRRKCRNNSGKSSSRHKTAT